MVPSAMLTGTKHESTSPLIFSLISAQPPGKIDHAPLCLGHP